jgi:bifunctional DNase/RNase
LEKIKLEILGLSSSQSEVGHFALVLGEAHGTRRLPIIIDGFQARAIALEIENIKSTRPMTHDLIVSIAKAFEVDLVEVIITDLKDGIFYSKLVFEQNGETREIDSRTSDAVAVGVRFKVPIYTYESVLSVAGIDVQEEEESEEIGDLDGPEDTVADKEDTGSDEAAPPPDKIRRLQEKMQEAIANEDYERAAKIRDEISRLEGTDN